MIRCEICFECTLPGEKPVRAVVQRRSKIYPPRLEEKPPDKGGTGSEIAREIMAHQACAREWLSDPIFSKVS